MLTERLKRLLFLVPYVAKHPGRRVDEVAAAAGLTREALLEGLETLMLVGRPPFQPDDLIDIYVEDDRVYVQLDQRLSAPPRLTPAEGAALAAAAALLKPRPGDPLHSALDKLERVLPESALPQYRAMSQSLEVATEAPEGLPALSRAIAEQREVTFEYLTPGRAEPERRRVRPLELKSHRGLWYLGAYDLSREGERLFRVDRLSALELTDTHFAGAPAPAPKATRSETQVKVRFAKTAAPYVLEQFGQSATRLPSGELEVLVPGDSVHWLTGWVASFGGEASVVEPAWAVEAVRASVAPVLDASPSA